MRGSGRRARGRGEVLRGRGAGRSCPRTSARGSVDRRAGILLVGASHVASRPVLYHQSLAYNEPKAARRTASTCAGVSAAVTRERCGTCYGGGSRACVRLEWGGGGRWAVGGGRWAVGRCCRARCACARVIGSGGGGGGGVYVYVEGQQMGSAGKGSTDLGHRDPLGSPGPVVARLWLAGRHACLQPPPVHR